MPRTHDSATITLRDLDVLAHVYPHYPLKPLAGRKVGVGVGVALRACCLFSIMIILSWCLFTGAAPKRALLHAFSRRMIDARQFICAEERLVCQPHGSHASPK
jgi:hypothetical protein